MFMSMLSTLIALWKEFRSKPDFVRCPCDICNGMVSTKTRMLRGEYGWYCCEESRARLEAAPVPSATSVHLASAQSSPTGQRGALTRAS